MIDERSERTLLGLRVEHVPEASPGEFRETSDADPEWLHSSDHQSLLEFDVGKSNLLDSSSCRPAISQSGTCEGERVQDKPELNTKET